MNSQNKISVQLLDEQISATAKKIKEGLENDLGLHDEKSQRNLIQLSDAKTLELLKKRTIALENDLKKLEEKVRKFISKRLTLIGKEMIATPPPKKPIFLNTDKFVGWLIPSSSIPIRAIADIQPILQFAGIQTSPQEYLNYVNLCEQYDFSYVFSIKYQSELNLKTLPKQWEKLINTLKKISIPHLAPLLKSLEEENNSKKFYNRIEEFRQAQFEIYRTHLRLLRRDVTYAQLKQINHQINLQAPLATLIPALKLEVSKHLDIRSIGHLSLASSGFSFLNKEENLWRLKLLDRFDFTQTELDQLKKSHGSYMKACKVLFPGQRLTHTNHYRPS